MGLFSIFGSDGKTKAAKFLEKQTRNIMGTPSPGGFQLQTGEYFDPLFNASYGPGGAGFRFTPQGQQIFDPLMNQFNQSNQLMQQYFQPGFLDSGKLRDMFQAARDAQVAATGRNLSNDVSKLFFDRGISSGSGDEAMRLQEIANAQNAAADAAVVQNLLNTRGLVQNQIGTDLSNLLGLRREGLSAVDTAAGLSGALTNVDSAIRQAALDAANVRAQAKAQKKTFLDKVLMAGDMALGAYMMGGGNFGMGSGPGFTMDTLSQAFTDPYGFRSFGQNLGSSFGNMGSYFNPASFGGTSFNPIINPFPSGTAAQDVLNMSDLLTGKTNFNVSG
jgi:hypothetical protein